MPILDIQRQFREIGRLRAGMKAHGTRKDGSSYTYPTRIDTWRFTSHNADILYKVADTYGGTVNPWDDQHEVVTTTDTVDVLVPGGVPISQWWEWWQGGTCERRCDGQRLTDDRPCLCAPEVEAGEDRKCSPTTRLSVFLPDVPDIGTWRVDTGSFYAARELGALWSLIERAQPGDLIPAKLRIDPREDRVRDDKGKVLVKKYNVVVVEFPEASIAELTRGLRPALDSPSRPELPAGPPPPAEVPAWQDDTDQAVGVVVASSPTQAPAPAAAPSADDGPPFPSSPDEQPGEAPPPPAPPRAAPSWDTTDEALDYARTLLDFSPTLKDTKVRWQEWLNELFPAVVAAGVWPVPSEDHDAADDGWGGDEPWERAKRAAVFKWSKGSTSHLSRLDRDKTRLFGSVVRDTARGLVPEEGAE